MTAQYLQIVYKMARHYNILLQVTLCLAYGVYTEKLETDFEIFLIKAIYILYIAIEGDKILPLWD